MALTAAELVAYLRLDKGGFDRGMSDAEGRMRKSQNKFQDWAGGMGRAAAEVATAGAAAVGGLATAVFSTGAGYNTLQQRSRAALETIMGGGENANKQMDKLDDFAKKSPFAKDVFIQAQQQLLGFGMEAEDVIPTLGGVEDAVAAVGGTNQDIAEIVNVLAEVEGTGKITADTFNRLGSRGIDAASIIGEEMGKTGNEIRESVTNGTLDADDAMRALTEGMTARFGGAAANVKETMTGATDRVTAAFRDMGSEMAKPFIDPNGGGRAIEWTNEFADVLRALEDQTGPLVDMLTRRLEPAFDGVSDKLGEARRAVERISLVDLNEGLSKLSAHAPSIAAASGALFTLGTQNVPIIGDLAKALGPIPAALGAAAAASPEFREALGDLWDVTEPLRDSVMDVVDMLSGTFTQGVEIASEALGLVVDLARPLLELFDSLPDPIQTVTTVLGGLVAVRKLFPKFYDSAVTNLGGVRGVASNMADGIGGAVDNVGDWAGAFEGALGSTEDFRAAVGLTVETVGTNVKSGMRGAFNGVVSFLGGPWGIAFGAATTVLGLWAQSQQESKERVDEFTNSLDEQTGAWTELTDAALAKELTDAFDRSEIDEMGISYGELADAVRNGRDGYDELYDRLVEQKVAMEDVEEGTAGYNDAQQSARTEVELFLNPLRVLSEDMEEAENVQREMADSSEEVAKASEEAVEAHKDYSEAVEDVSDHTKTLTERTDGLRKALDTLRGEEMSQEEAEREWEATKRSLTEVFQDQIEAVDGNTEALFDLEEGTFAYTDAGDALESSLKESEEDLLNKAQAAYDAAGGDDNAAEAAAAAAEVYEDGTETLRDLMEQAGFTSDEIDIATESMNNVPELIEFIMSDGGSIEATDIELLDLADRIDATPDGWVDISDNSPEAVGRLEDLNYDVEHLKDGTVRVRATGIETAHQNILDGIVNRNYTVDVRAKFALGDFLNVPSKGGKGGVPYRPGLAPNYYGGIDVFRGMADGGVTGPNVMDVAQMVAPGDIRFAGDRSDVDEAWIPLDGSKRSIGILEEAIARMPNYEPPQAEGMKDGGVSGRVTPPSVDQIEGPDTSELTDTWQEAMETLTDSTEGTFDEMSSETSSKQKAMEAIVASSGRNMLSETSGAQREMADRVASSSKSMSSDTSGAQKSMRSDVAESSKSMSSDTSGAQKSMRSDVAESSKSMQTSTRDAQANMSSETSSRQQDMSNVTRRQLDNRSRDTASQNAKMEADTRTNLGKMKQATSDQTSAMSQLTQQNVKNMRTGAVSELSSMRASSRTEFQTMKTQGVTAASDLRTGVVSQMGAAESPFTSKVSALVNVMRSFSSSLNNAYSDMGVSVGTPARLATGGILPGYTPGRDVHKFVSDTGAGLELSGGEGIARPEVVRAMGASRFNQLNSAARRGGTSAVRSLLGSVPTQSFAGGGIFDELYKDAKDIGADHKQQLKKDWVRPVGVKTIDTVTKELISQLEEMLSSGSDWIRPTKGRVTSEYGAGRGKYPHAGMDIAKREGEPTVAPVAGIVRKTGWNIGPGRSGIGSLVEHAAKMFTYYGHNPVGGLRVKVGDVLKQGDRIGGQGSTGNATGAHLHWEVHKQSPWNDTNPRPYWDAAGGGGGGPIGGGSDKWSSLVKAALKLNNLPTSDRYVSAWMRQIQTESGGNPAAVQQISDINSRSGNHARGLLQVIPPTFAAYAKSGMKNIMNPLHNAVAGMAYAKSRYGVGGMLNAIGRGRGYKDGTRSAVSGWHLVGELGPELVKFAGGEQVKNHRQTQRMVQGGGLSARDADKIGRAMAKYVPEGGNLVIDRPQTRDTDELTRMAATRYRRTKKQLSRR